MAYRRQHTIAYNVSHINKNTVFLSVVPSLPGSFDMSSVFLNAVVSSPFYWLLTVFVFVATVAGILLLRYLRNNKNQNEGTIHTLEYLLEEKKSKVDTGEIQKKQESPAEISSQKEENRAVQEKKERGIFNISSFLKRERVTQSLAYAERDDGAGSRKPFSLKALSDAGFSVPSPSGLTGGGIVIPDARLLKYVRDARKFGMTDEEIAKELTKVGWNSSEISNALSYT